MKALTGRLDTTHLGRATHCEKYLLEPASDSQHYYKLSFKGCKD